MASPGEVNEGYYPDANDEDDGASKANNGEKVQLENDEQRSVDAEIAEHSEQQFFSYLENDDDNLSKETHAVLSPLHSPITQHSYAPREALNSGDNFPLTHLPSSHQAPTLLHSQNASLLHQDTSPHIVPPSQPSDVQPLDIFQHQQHLRTIPMPPNSPQNFNSHPPAQLYPSPYPLPYVAPPPYQLISTHEHAGTADAFEQPAFGSQGLPPSYDVAIRSSSSSSVFFTSPAEIHGLREDLAGGRPVPPFRIELWLSCFTFWFCGVFFGLVAFILASKAVDRAQARREREARYLGRASLSVSMTGILCGLIVIIILATGLIRVTPSYSPSAGHDSGASSQCYCQLTWYGLYAYRNCKECYKATTASPKCTCQRFNGDTYDYRNCGDCLTTTSAPMRGGFCYCRTYAYGPMDHNTPCQTCYGAATPEPSTCFCKATYYGSSDYRSCSQCYALSTTSQPPQCYCQASYYGSLDYRSCTECYQPSASSPRQCYCKASYYGSLDYRSCTECYQTSTSSPRQCYCQASYYGSFDYRSCTECYQTSTSSPRQCYCKASYYSSYGYRDCSLCY